MNMRLKIIFGVIFVILALLIIPLTLTSLIVDQPEPQKEPVQENVASADPSKITGETFTLDEGYIISIPENWDLLIHEEDRQVDRYRFERNGDAKGIFTISFYIAQKNFDDVLEARYGSGFVSEPKEMLIDGKEAILAHSAFYEQGDTADMIVRTDETSFLSLYGVFLPDGADGQEVKNEIRFMQESLRSS